MDDSFEQPTALPKKIPPSANVEDQEEQSSGGEEDGALDWTKLSGGLRLVIPKRGEKDFEPKPGGGSGLQVHVLDAARTAMFEALRAKRTISSKAVSYAVWHPGMARAHVTVAKGIHFSTMGHSVPRPVVGEGGVQKVHKRLELLPEETLYLIERGSLFCWKQSDLDLSHVPGLSDIPGPPMTVQQVYSELIGMEDLTLERFQVYTYLKRLGYSVTRAVPPNSFYPSAAPYPAKPKTMMIFQRILSIFPFCVSRLYHYLMRGFDWWRPVRISRWLHHDKNYGYLFRSMRFISAGYSIPLHHPNIKKQKEDKKASPYQIFFNLYKPSTPFKRSAPPPPDFQIVVINARTTPMPTLQELTDLFDVLPEQPPPLPRRRRPVAAPQASPAPQPTAMPSSSHTPSLIRRLFPWVFSPTPPVHLAVPARRPNPFMALKAGHKMIVIAVVDAGSISFFRFSQGAFTDWPMA